MAHVTSDRIDEPARPGVEESSRPGIVRRLLAPEARRGLNWQAFAALGGVAAFACLVISETSGWARINTGAQVGPGSPQITLGQSLDLADLGTLELLSYYMIWSVLFIALGVALTASGRIRRVTVAAGLGAAASLALQLVGVAHFIHQGARLGGAFSPTSNYTLTLDTGFVAASAALALMVVAFGLTATADWVRQRRAARQVQADPQPPDQQPIDLAVSPAGPAVPDAER